MKYIEEQLIKEKKKLENELEKIKKRLKDVPRGRIYVKQKGRRVEYYYKKERENVNSKEIQDALQQTLSKTEKSGKYIKKEHMNIARQIAQRDYDSSLLQTVEKRIKAIEDFLIKYKKTNISQIYEKTNEHRRILLGEAIISEKEYVKRWENIEYTGKNFTDDAIEIYSNRGERVRSKSEKIIADRLQILGIPYRYEYPLKLKDDVTVYPDFTLLNIDTKEEIYLEHCGLMNEQSYVDNLMFKFKSYERNGIYLGVNLFITYESNRYPFNGKVLDELIKRLFSCTKHDLLINSYL